MRWKSTSSGAAAYDAMHQRLVALTPDHANIEQTTSQCDGMTFWRAYLNRNPAATISDCLDEFEARMARNGKRVWTHRLLELFGLDAEPDIITRVLDQADPILLATVNRSPNRYGFGTEMVEYAKSLFDPDKLPKPVRHGDVPETRPYRRRPGIENRRSPSSRSRK